MAAKKKMEIKTKSGFTWEIDPNVADDMELMDELGKLGRGEGDKLPSDILVKMIGEDGKAALYEHCKVGNRVSAKKAIPMVEEIYLLAVEALKKV